LGLQNCREHQDYFVTSNCIFGPENVFTTSNKKVKNLKKHKKQKFIFNELQTLFGSTKYVM
jgi:hypothetical protein